ncbi:TolC family protein [Roseiconus lacunae]|uniref:TolC family protein n=1 Tax=Roseiconus lacunae TaxID=2605694 RepID=UPI001F2DACA7|nr:TolC family protein [Roseiconus lacunae]MCD0459598.1 TolC family protein [Roseiconus lacunae]WRQ49614.1 TolC family protein [Stieleria sp. HD01]
MAIACASLTLTTGAGLADEPPRQPESFAAFLSLVEADSLTENDGATRGGDRSERVVESGRSAAGAIESAAEKLTLADVVASLYRSYPEIAQAREISTIAAGDRLSAFGAYDTKFQAHSLSEPTGFYENYRNGLGVARQLWWGGYLSAGYRIGRGYFQPWYKERSTDEGGEGKLTWIQPLLRGRALDAERVAVFQATLAQQAAQPQLLLQILQSSGDAVNAYWDWVASGATLQAQRELLNLAEVRAKQIQVGVEAGKYKRVDLIFNQQLIAERRADALKAEQKFRASSIKLGLYLRNESGDPLIPDDGWLPMRFPQIQSNLQVNLQDELAGAFSRRPEPEILMLDLQSVHWDRRLACNDMLPTLDFYSQGSQDIGPAATKDDDKGEFELIIGVQSEVPIQRRKARGKIQSTSAKMRQINQKLRLVRDKIATEIAVANNRLTLAEQVVQQRQTAFRSALDTLTRYRIGFEQGYIDLIYLNLLETKANETEIKLVEAQQDWFIALSQLQQALGLDPLEQAMIVGSLPESEMIGPGNVPEIKIENPQEIEDDFGN